MLALLREFPEKISPDSVEKPVMKCEADTIDENLNKFGKFLLTSCIYIGYFLYVQPQ